MSYEKLHSFGFPELMGQQPPAPPIHGSDGVLYGTAATGGRYHSGVVYRINQDGTGYEAFLHLGSSPDDANTAGSALTEGSDGALYSVSLFGGVNHIGAVLKVNKDGSGYRLLHEFGTGFDGQKPTGRLLEASDGFLYGTTPYGGLDNFGTVFKLRKDGTGYEVIRDFGETARFARRTISNRWRSRWPALRSNC